MAIVTYGIISEDGTLLCRGYDSESKVRAMCDDLNAKQMNCRVVEIRTTEVLVEI